jgi:trimeric autotransporter adhesin
LIGSPFTTTVSVTTGLFTVSLNFGGNVFNGDGRWLDIQVNCGSGFVALTPRQALTPAPYAFALPGLYTTQNITSPNLIGGYSGNTVAPGVFGATIGGGGTRGSENRVQANYATVGGATRISPAPSTLPSGEVPSTWQARGRLSAEA